MPIVNIDPNICTNNSLKKKVMCAPILLVSDDTGLLLMYYLVRGCMANYQRPEARLTAQMVACFGRPEARLEFRCKM